MLSGILGSHTRRYVIVVVFFLVCVVLWHGFSLAPSDSYSETSSTSSTEPKVIDSFKYLPSTFDWSKVTPKYPPGDIKWPPSSWPKTFPRVQARTTSAMIKDDIAAKRKQIIRTKFVKSWEAYKAHAWTKDELMPLSGKGKQSLSGWSAQLVDAMDTLWIMDLKDEFRRAVKEVAVIDWATTSDERINLFEVIIRYLGGLLAAYDLSEEPALLAKAVELGDAMYAAFDTPNRFPPRWLSYETVRRGDQLADESMSGAAGGTMCLEFTRLSQITGDPKYYDATERLKQFFRRSQNETAVPGLWPHDLNYRDEVVDGHRFNLGAGMDSLYEYLPKMHALLGGQDPEYVAMTVSALDAIRDNLLFRPMTPADADILLAGSLVVEDDGQGPGRTFTADMEHLTCFAGGMYGLAGKLLGRSDYVDVGARLTSGCVWAYDAFSTNLMPEKSRLVACAAIDGPCPFDSDALPKGRARTLPEGFVGMPNPKYLLRPEAIESVFYMWRITGDHTWREAAWRMWEGLVRETETEMAFASIADVTKHSSAKIDSMETFWMGETLKYFYLIFDDESNTSLDEWVFNTEAHPFKRPQ
ncbi:mannosyl-oligosaccharide alpha-1,2-mannosidase [Geosmithia morbida]|uniref:alpha-1,2-Mannosidase n=1 Tax=Geosmithia morbida TaxID=1094350 RepID=A0A9P5D311_9HYPO|nr:mannosyl-oligosaccharide alpha-1,2-mannosidase [Geosmithia morbida]KAF4125688.1 mannosyl-oligosaccharide alpha-1,2-mannosidase [Geosmithia morbida]